MIDIKKLLIEKVQQNKLTLDEAQAIIGSVKEGISNDKIAIIGYDFLLPDAKTLYQLALNCKNRHDSVKNLPKNRYDDIVYLNQKTHTQYNGLNCRVGGYLDSIDKFDYGYFELNKYEAEIMDPAQRLLLESSYKALEHANITKDQLNGLNMGVFVGYSLSDDNYFDLFEDVDSQVMLANQPAMLAYRMSYLYNLTGPTMTVDTTCSSSLAALHTAIQNIRQGDCGSALVAGVNLRIFPVIKEISNLGIEAYDGRCKSFDKSANGTNIGDGIVCCVIKSLSKAIEDNDYIHAVIEGSAINSDGHSNGLTSPNPIAQGNLILKAWERSNINPDNLAFIEAHGTGTSLGDPIEVNALKYAFAQTSQAKHVCPLTAIKSYVGHLEASAGLAGLINVLANFKYRHALPNLHFKEPNPHIDFENSPVFPASNEINFESDRNLIAGLSSFGLSGTNIHMVISDYLTKNRVSHDKDTMGPHIIYFSAKNKDALLMLLADYMPYLQQEQPNISDLAFSTAVARNHYEHRMIIIAFTTDELIAKLKQIVKHKDDLFTYLNDEPTIFYNKEHYSLDNESIGLAKGEMLHLQLYLSGETYADSHPPDVVGHKIPLPTYHFNETRCWPKLQITKPSKEQKLKGLLYDLKWCVTDSNIDTSSLSKDQCWLCFINDRHTQEALIDFLEQKSNVILIQAGEVFKENDYNNYELNYGTETEYRKLFKLLNEKNINITGIVHALDLNSENLNPEYDELYQIQQQGAFSAFHILRAWKKHYSSSDLYWLTMTSNAYHICTEDLDKHQPYKLTAAGITLVAGQEFPRIQSTFVDIDKQSQNDKTFNNLFFKAMTYKRNHQHLIAYRDGKQYKQILDKHREKNGGDAIAITEFGTYIIAGGLGYLGIETAIMLAKSGARSFVLISRSANKNVIIKDLASLAVIKDAYKYNKLKQLIAMDCCLHILKLDATSKSDISKLKQYLVDHDLKLSGSILSIKGVSHEKIATMPTAVFESNILAKLYGSMLITNLSRDMGADFVVFFSSISSLTGGPTGADCAAQNIFLDDYQFKGQAEDPKLITVNYTLIDADDGSLLTDRMSMIPPITKYDAMDILNYMLSTGQQFIAAANFNPRVMHKVIDHIKINFSQAILDEFNQPETSRKIIPEVRKSTDIQMDNISLLSEIWKETLHLSEIDMLDNFFDVGGDSISSIKLAERIKNKLKITINVTDIYSYPTIKDLSDYIGKLQIDCSQDVNLTEGNTTSIKVKSNKTSEQTVSNDIKFIDDALKQIEGI